MFLTSPSLAALPGIAHGFFTRKGGVSEGVFSALNCGWGSSDVKANVAENRQRVAKALGTTTERLWSLYQVHGDKVITVEGPRTHPMLQQADAMVTKVPGLALGILTADCVPVLFADSEAGVIGAAHAGWKGTLAGVLTQTIAAMRMHGAHTSSIIAAIGPSIAQASYEVSAGFEAPFIERNPDFAGYFIPASRAAHLLFDLGGLIRNILAKAGISAINLLENDTYLEEDNFFSFRRATHLGEPDYGRQISAIMLTRK